MALKKLRPKPKSKPSLGKQQEAELMRVYNSYWSNYIKGDVKAMASLLDEDYTQVGSAEAEVFFNKKDAVKFLHDTIDQVAGKADLRNRVIRVEPQKEFILVTELDNLYVLIGNEWTFHSKFRASTLMRKKKGAWKLYHQHSSFPDIRAQEGENISIEKIAMENLQLRDAVKRRTVELEQKTRDLKVEATLEHVRARAMAMRNSSELAETSAELFHQINELGIHAIRTGVGIFDDPSDAMELWLTTVSESKEVVRVLDYVNLHIHPVFENIIPARKDNKPYALTVLKGNEVKQYYSTMSTYLSLPRQQTYNTEEFFYSFFFTQGAINVIAIQALTTEECNIMGRLASVFGVIFTRFLDLQKAEAQTREGQIELALERVRARTMAMHKSDELVETSVVLFQELRTLGVSAIRTGVAVFDRERETMELWSSQLMEQKQNPVLGVVPIKLHPFFDNLFQAWKRNDQDFTFALSGDEVKEYYQTTSTLLSYPPQKEYNSVEIFNPFFFPEGSLTVVSHDPLSDEERNIMRRFANVFGLLYRRFLDLQKAEAQAREAQIEAALERVRASSMAMHHSNDLHKVINAMSIQLYGLNFRFNSTNFILVNPDRSWDLRISTPDQPYPADVHMPLFEHRLIHEVDKVIKDRIDLYPIHLNKEEKNDMMKYLFENTAAKAVPDERKQFVYDAPSWELSVMALRQIVFAVSNYEDVPYSPEENAIIKRFGGVFDQSYTRFLDLQKAESQAREALIEASLERVRAKAMAMHSSKDLSDSIEVFYKELLTLGLRPRRVGVALTDRESRIARLTTMSTTEQGITTVVEGNLKMDGHWLLEDAFNHWLRQEEFHGKLKGNEINEYYKVVRPQIAYPEYPHDATQHGYYFMFPEGNVVAWTEKELPEEELQIFRRFTSVISLTYKRHKDLSDAEARALLAVREASLDRVRAEIASMRHADDLQRITPLMWRELKTLGVPFFRCGVLIINEQTERADYYLSTPEGRPLAALHLDFKTNLQVVQTALDHWRQQKVYIDHWNKEQFVVFARSMMELGQIQTMKSYQGGDQPPEKITLQFIPFAQGMLYVGGSEDLTTDQVELVHSLAEAFSTAYARYEDFTRLEAAKATVENTLSELRTTQTQLVQSEKMASLGELTAGIAHEIQNPLNFVNNFSEVSGELLDEMVEEVKKGNLKDIQALVDDVKQNLDKIHFHGKRADGIVKSMLQHSRKSTGQKEPTDINALCDEYLRLSYHGLRAKDKSFNAKFETDLDPNVEKLNVLPQEIGRVILNLINNAFYAVSEKKRLNPDSYEPTVTVTTKNTGNNIEIKVRDNGTGIPQKALDKIFNPFFTTKPTGQGTGLGLSLSYDIITKGHGGELKVVTREGEGSEFVVQLPISS